MEKQDSPDILGMVNVVRCTFVEAVGNEHLKNINKDMDLSNLQPAYGSNKTGKRIGRGTGSGKGGTSTRGHKGQKFLFGLFLQRLF